MKASHLNTNSAAFGSVGERFVKKKVVRINLEPPSEISTTIIFLYVQSTQPGPGAYDLTEKVEIESTAKDVKLALREQSEKRREHNKLQKLLTKGPNANLLIGSFEIPTEKAHMPIFGTQTERFADIDSGTLHRLC